MKRILVIFALLCALGASGQLYIDSYRFGAGAPPATLLLDDYPNAAAAYSLRKLRTAYTGNCIVVRRSSNNDTLAIGFSGNYLDTAALKTFCASTDCFVRTWYDQSVNGRNVAQTTNANQPRIVNAGVIERRNGQCTVFTYALFNTTSSVLTINQSTFTGSTGTKTGEAISLGGRGASSSGTFLNGNIQEFITYFSNQSANQANIRSNINSFYNVY
jgi:hypothetical protein